jgi:acyl-[acyl-carrier-protein]-phospholipid O-acyltransferase/long-chain-fatty-acid--[acyl-carrier-protein] ligase
MSLARRFVRGLALALLRAIYRISVHGLENLPGGGALIVANHLSHVDALVLGAALAPREARFLMHRSFFSVPVVGAFSRWMGAMPVASEDTPERKAESLALAAGAARAGELVCIFAEGGISRSGALLPFARGMETIARDARVPIVPVALDRLWGSIFSFSGGRFFWKLPRRIPYPVEVAVGEPMPSDSDRWRVRDAVAELVARSREQRLPRTRSLAYRFVRSARKNGGRIAFVDADGTATSFRTILRRALVLRAVLRRTAAVTGRIGIRIPPGADAAIAHAAVALAGRVAVPMDDSWEARHVDRILECLRDVEGESRASDRALARISCWYPGRWLARRLDPVRDGREPAALLVGRSGEPPVLLSHAGIASSAESVAQMFGFGPGESVLCTLPFSSVLGSVAGLWIPLLSGGRAIRRRSEPATVVVATAAEYRRWLAEAAPESFRGARLFFCAGSAPGADLPQTWSDRFGVELCEGYGCAELSGVVAVNLPGIESNDPRQNASRPGTVGRAIPGVAVRIVDPVTHALLPPEKEGLLLARGPGRMLGYDGEPERTSAAFREGWFVTGDRALLDKDAFLVIAPPPAGGILRRPA